MRRHLLLFMIAALAACTQPVHTSTPRPEHGTITRRQIDGITASTALDVVSRFRSDALRAKPPVSIFLDPHPYAAVFMDGQYYGLLDALRNVPADWIQEIRIYDDIEAAHLFGRRYAGGVIQLVSRRR